MPKREKQEIFAITQRPFSGNELDPINEQPYVGIFQPGTDRLDYNLAGFLLEYAREAGVTVGMEMGSFEERQRRESSLFRAEWDAGQLPSSLQRRGGRKPRPREAAAYHWIEAIFVSLASAGSVGAISRALVDYAKTRRSSVHLRFRGVDIDLKQHPDPAEEIARMLKTLRADADIEETSPTPRPARRSHVRTDAELLAALAEVPREPDGTVPIRRAAKALGSGPNRARRLLAEAGLLRPLAAAERPPSASKES